MKILVPLNNIKYIDKFIEAGTDQFYMGFEEEGWYSTFGHFSDLNRMSGFNKRANKYTLNEVIDIAKYLDGRNVDLFVTFNAARYSEQQIQYIENYFKALSKSKINGVIVSCPELVLLAKKYKIDAVCSTMCGIYNSDILKFYENIGAKKIIFPRDLTIAEISSMIQEYPNLKYEVFIMRNGCVFSDSNCLCMHREPYNSLCGMLMHAKRRIITSNKTFLEKQEFRVNGVMYNDFYRRSACGLCAIYDFLRLGVDSCKIVGRADNESYILNDIRLVKENIKLAISSKSKEEYLEKMNLPYNYEQCCNLGYSCYYPEVRFGE